MSRPPTPQFKDREDGGWEWEWKIEEGIDGQVRHEVKLVWRDEKWLASSRYSEYVNGRWTRGGWGPDLLITDLDDPESFDHADNLARDYAARPRGG